MDEDLPELNPTIHRDIVNPPAQTDDSRCRPPARDMA
jgi:hypothetical protein